MKEQAADLGRRLANYYGSAVVVEYVDVFSPQVSEHPVALRFLQRQNVPLPLICVNGQPKFAGGISIGRISEELENLGVTPLDEPEAS